MTNPLSPTAASSLAPLKHHPMFRFLRQKIKSKGQIVKKWASKAIQEVEASLTIKETGQKRDPLRQDIIVWYYLTFCLGYGAGYSFIDGNYKIKNRYILPSEVANHLQNPLPQHNGLHASPAQSTVYALIDIDNKASKPSQYHPFKGSKGEGPVIKALKTIGLKKAIMIKSSSSGGIHLIYPLRRPVPSKELARAIKAALNKAQIEIMPGTLEIFPECKNGKAQLSPIRLPLSGKDNLLYIPEIGIWTDDISALKCIFEKIATHNKLIRINTAKQHPTQFSHHHNITSYSNTRGPVKLKRKQSSNYSIQYCLERLDQGFSRNSQSQEIKICALIIAGAKDGISNEARMKERVHELIEICSGYKEYCRHQNQIKNRTYLSRKEIKDACQMKTAIYQGSWKETANTKKRIDAAERATNAIKKCLNEGKSFKSQNQAIKELQRIYGAPTRSWWRKHQNSKYKESLSCIISRQHDLVAENNRSRAA